MAYWKSSANTRLVPYDTADGIEIIFVFGKSPFYYRYILSKIDRYTLTQPDPILG